LALGVDAVLTSADHARDIKITLLASANGQARVVLEVRENGDVVQRNLYTFSPDVRVAKGPSTSAESGEPISINLEDADLKDVLNTFAQLTGYDVAMSKDVAGVRVTMNVKDMPWDEALKKMAADNGLVVTIEGKKINVHR
jgi:type II secretory pathway component HofQ